MKHLTILAVALPAFCMLFAAEKSIKLQDAPAAVQATVKAQTQTARMVGLSKEVENGKTEYELETKVNGKSRDLMIGTDGSILSVEEEVTLDSIPAAAKAAIEAKASGGKIGKVESVTENGTTSYEAQITVKGKRSEVAVTAAGQPAH